MATTGDAGLANAATVAAAVESVAGRSDDKSPPKPAVEMSQLDTSAPPDGPKDAVTASSMADPTTPEPLSARPRLETFSSAQTSFPDDQQQTAAASSSLLQPPASPTDPESSAASRARAESTAIGPSADLSSNMPIHSDSAIKASQSPGSPAVLITLLLTTGARHPYKVDERYLRRRNIIKEDETEIDPFAISVYTLKELIWRDWREEWESRPTSPSSIRLIHFGKLLEDKSSLKECRFTDANPNVVHMTVKPSDFIDDEENAKLKKTASRTSRGSGEREAGCRCCSVM